jgi:low temperature requirement protein LtrA
MAATPVPIASPHDQSATFVELFFDLVFVFSVTQVAGLLHSNLTWAGAGQAILAFWLVWWAWTQFTWALNAANTEHPHVQFATLAAAAVAFFMAVSLPNAFQGGALAFALPYVLMRVIGLGLYARVAQQNPSQKNAVRTFATVSVGGLAAVWAGAVAGGPTIYWLWGAAILFDVVAAAVGGQAEGWDLHAGHFCERHGLFVIIALGETLIVAATGLTGTRWTPDLLGVAVLAVGVTCGLWWTYFPRNKPALEHALRRSSGPAQSMLARDIFSLLHFPMVCGIIAYAVAIEEMAAHPSEPLAFTGRLSLALGLVLFVGGLAVAMLRATCGGLLPRAILTTAAAVAILGIPGAPPLVALSIAFGGVCLIAAIEQRGPSVDEG